MDLGIKGKVALVMASSRGLGQAMAVALAREGVKVAVTGRSPEGLQKSVELILYDLAFKIRNIFYCIGSFFCFTVLDHHHCISIIFVYNCEGTFIQLVKKSFFGCTSNTI